MRTASCRSARLATRWSHPQTQAAQCLRTGSPNAVVQKRALAGPAGPQCNGAGYHTVLQMDDSLHAALQIDSSFGGVATKPRCTGQLCGKAVSSKPTSCRLFRFPGGTCLHNPQVLLSLPFCWADPALPLKELVKGRAL